MLRGSSFRSTRNRSKCPSAMMWIRGWSMKLIRINRHMTHRPAQPYYPSRVVRIDCDSRLKRAYSSPARPEATSSSARA